jgi:hypothetical protein
VPVPEDGFIKKSEIVLTTFQKTKHIVWKSSCYLFMPHLFVYSYITTECMILRKYQELWRAATFDKIATSHPRPEFGTFFINSSWNCSD